MGDDDVTKEIKKDAQKKLIQSTVGPSMNEKKQTDQEKAKKDGETKINTVKNNLASVSKEMGDVVKGKFGKKIKENFKNQSESLEKFSE